MHADIELLPTPPGPRTGGRPKLAPVVVATDRPAYHRQPGESHAAFEAFATFRDAGPGRTLSKVAEIVGRSHSSVANWSSKYGWPARVAVWNRETAKDHQQRMEEHQRATLDRQHRQGEEVENLLHAKVIEQIQADRVHPRDVLPNYVALRKDQRQVDGWSEQRGSTGPVVQVNVGSAVPAFDSRLSALATAVATWGSTANLTADQLAGLSAAILEVQAPA